MIRFLFLCLSFSCYGAVLPHLPKVPHDADCISIPNIDFIYLINLDQRPEKYKASIDQLHPFSIQPMRISAVYGWYLPKQLLHDIGLVFTPEMWRGKENVLYVKETGYYQFIGLNESCYGSPFFSSWMTPGGIGCTLSHLSVLQNAELLGFETIWILEDDIVVLKDPHLLSQRIVELDGLVGREGWDILYTDPNHNTVGDETKDLLEQCPMKWRPDMPHFDLRSIFEYTRLGEHFFKIGGRLRTHSMIIRKSGIEKIMDFYRTHGIFLPYDHELSFIPGLRFYVVDEAIVDCEDHESDTKDRHF